MIRVIVVTSSPLLRAGLESVVEIASAAQTLDEAAALDADVIVIDWDREDARELVEFAAESPPLVVLASEARPAWLSDAVRAGVRGVLSRDASPAEVSAAIAAAVAGLVVLQPESVESVVRIAPRRAMEPLSPREIEVLRLMSDGSSNKTIAWKLNISEHTVKFHINSILGKLNAGSRTEAVMLGLRSGLIPL